MNITLQGSDRKLQEYILQTPINVSQVQSTFSQLQKVPVTTSMSPDTRENIMEGLSG